MEVLMEGFLSWWESDYFAGVEATIKFEHDEILIKIIDWDLHA